MSKRVKTWIPITIIAVFFIGLIFGRPHLLKWISKSQRNHLSQNQTTTISDNINTLYNYADNGGKYEFTFLEFGSNGCSACKQMERVMEQIKVMYPNQVNVVFISVMDSSNKDLMNYFGVSAIPFQVLLDRNGNEFYRHTGYISETDLSKHFK